MLGVGDLVQGHLTGYDVSNLETADVTASTRKIEPHVRLDEVLRDAFAFLIHGTEDELRGRFALVRRQAEPPRRLLVVLRDTIAAERYDSDPWEVNIRSFVESREDVSIWTHQ
jgi:hypothetical protein